MSYTNRAFRVIRIVLLIAICFILGEAAARAFPNPLGFLEGKQSSPTPAPAAEAAPAPVAPGGVPGIPASFATIAKEVKPSVVNVSTTQTVHTEGGPEPFGGPFSQQDPFQEFFRHFFNQEPRNFTQRSLGSGVIIDPSGYIVTNAHVIAHADKIVVKLEDGREFDAKVVGSDPKTDVAVLKIAAPPDLPAAHLGNSDSLQVGDWVIAIGNPFGLSETVTAGIVSAKGRVIGEGPYEDFIQTDASINPGNSGGPLVNMEGQVIGINAAIFSQSGGNIGIGFAIPINLVKNVAQEIRQYGKVVRGWLGVTIQQVTPQLAKSFGLENAEGALVSEVEKGSPADKAGFRQGDIIVEFDGKPVNLAHQLPTMVAESKIGQTVPVAILRHGERKTLEVTVEEMPASERVANLPESATPWGLAVADITPKLRQRYDLEQSSGVVVTEVKRGSVADEAGIRPGDVVREVDHEPVDNVQDYEKVLAKTGNAPQVLLLLQRQGQSLFVVLQKRG
jgi:serine protease Do